MGAVLVIFGLSGLAGGTWFFPCLALLFYRRDRKVGHRENTPSIEILIPAHDEAEVLARTLSSIAGAPVRVGADACSDRTAEIACSFNAEVETFAFGSKWHTVRALVATSRADWCILVDAGAVWPANFLARVLPWMRLPDVVGIAPAYAPMRSGLFEAAHWKVERWLKSLESGSGGPISVHGATVAYRRANLEAALERLGKGPWTNDDVVIPWAIRRQEPASRIVYLPEVRVDDAGLKKAGEEFPRRKRMALGNVEWVRDHFIPFFSRTPAQVNLLGLRRVCRMLWAYWTLLLGLGLMGLGSPIYTLALLTAGVLILRRKLVGAAKASLLVPFYAWRGPLPERLAWG